MIVRVQRVDDGGHVVDEAEVEFEDSHDAQEVFEDLAAELEGEAEPDEEFARMGAEDSEG